MQMVRPVRLVMLASLLPGAGLGVGLVAWAGAGNPVLADALAAPTPLTGAVLPMGPAPMPQEIPAVVSVADVIPYGSKVEPTTFASLANAANPANAGNPANSAPAGDPINLAYPLGSLAESMDPWGWRYSNARAAWRMHTGVDLAAATGTPVQAALAGRVLLVGSVSGYGTTVLLDHGNGLETLYAHLSRVDVREGDWLEQAGQLGAVGMSGAASGPHLHFELRRRGAQLQAIDPTPHLPPLMAPPVLAAR